MSLLSLCSLLFFLLFPASWSFYHFIFPFYQYVDLFSSLCYPNNCSFSCSSSVFLYCLLSYYYLTQPFTASFSFYAQPSSLYLCYSSSRSIMHERKLTAFSFFSTSCKETGPLHSFPNPVHINAPFIMCLWKQGNITYFECLQAT